MNNRKYIICLSWIPSILVMIIIFSFSAKVADDSNKTSGGITGKVISVIEYFTGEAIEEDSAVYEQIHHIIRKTGHFLEYMALGCTLVLPFKGMFVKKYYIFILSQLLSTVYACTDEFHQLFVEGRSGSIKDVAIDSIGALAGVCLGFALWYFVEKCVILRKKCDNQ